MTDAPLPVSSLIRYLTNVSVPWRSMDFDVRNIARGMKQEPFNGFSGFHVGGKHVVYTNENIEEFMLPLLTRVGRHMSALDREVDVVPIPGSTMAVGAPGPFRIEHLASLFIRGYGKKATLVSAIRWDAPRNKTHQSYEPRSPDVHQPRIRLVARPTRPILLFDDIMTSGSQMIAAARFLREQGFNLAAGCVVARVTDTQHERMIAWTTEDLPIKREIINFDDC